MNFYRSLTEQILFLGAMLAAIMINGLGDKILKENFLEYFCEEVTSAKILEYQKIL